MAGIASPPYPSPPSRQGLMGHRPSISHGEAAPHPPPSPPLTQRRPSAGTRSTLDHRRVSIAQGYQGPSNHSPQSSQDAFPHLRGFRGRKPSIVPTNSRRFSSGWEDMEVVNKIYNGSLPSDYFDSAPAKRPRRRSVAVPTYAYLSKDFKKDQSSLLPHDVEAAGPSSKRRGVHMEIRLQEAAWRHHQKLSAIAGRCRQHFKKVEDVKLNNDETDRREMQRIEAATKNLRVYK